MGPLDPGHSLESRWKPLVDRASSQELNSDARDPAGYPSPMFESSPFTDGIGELLIIDWLDQPFRTDSAQNLPDLVISLLSIRVSAGRYGERCGNRHGER